MPDNWAFTVYRSFLIQMGFGKPILFKPFHIVRATLNFWTLLRPLLCVVGIGKDHGRTPILYIHIRRAILRSWSLGKAGLFKKEEWPIETNPGLETSCYRFWENATPVLYIHIRTASSNSRPLKRVGLIKKRWGP